jgi:Flp pilus assembly pilin Flp
MKPVLDNKMSWWRAEMGQSLVEYGLIIALIAILCVAGLTLMGQAINTQLYDQIVTNLNTAI